MINPAAPPTSRQNHDPLRDAKHSASEDSIYVQPRLDPSKGPMQTKTEVLHNDDYSKISRQAKWDFLSRPPELKQLTLVMETGNAADAVHVGKNPDGRLKVQINGKSYALDDKDRDGKPLHLLIKTHGGNDQVTVSEDVKNPLTIEGGKGDDTLTGGGGITRLLGGPGNDTLKLRSHAGYAEGNDGDDTIIGGPGNSAMYGNNGDDRLYAGAGPATKQSYLDGGAGNDRLYAGNGHTVLHGGKGDDDLVGHDRTTFYTGKGQDRVWNNQQGDHIYAKTGDVYDRSQGSTLTPVQPSTAGGAGFGVVGTPQFKQRVEDDLEFLRGSPTGQKMLTDMDREAAVAGGKVTIEEQTDRGNAYNFGSLELDKAWENGRRIDGDDPKRGKITDNKPGSRANKGVIAYDTSTTVAPDGRTFGFPLIGLVHEVGHSYNGATGTNLPGTTIEHPPARPDISIPTRNTEFQVVGLPSSASPFDFDNDPSTPPTRINPEHFTENGMRREMGLPERKTYLT
ncbi:M91 family zinc metallopeptidase [Pseudomonas sp. S5D5]|uniref:M91 family zinc metallopeptidase n=1 Tax=Pseudomonas sp. S5D5 TaxID=2083056 RepID=UPI002114198D|nr:M91 family zinc metallopeptidase [Pseudomonas sp. S5D5]